jgi:predicted  nucleic acid-binding Zn-ribbon protein
MNAISESVKILRDAGLNEKQLLAHLEVIERNMREHAVSPQEFNEFRIEVKNEFGEFRNEVNEKFNKVDERFNKIDEQIIKLEQRINKAIFTSTGILISFIALLQFFNK